MAWCRVNFRGESLGKQSSLELHVPETGDGPFPVLYVLHGLSDNQTTWNLRVPLDAMVAELPLILALPDGERGFYCNNPSPGGGQWEDHIVQDVVSFVDRTFPTVASRTGRALAGNSMGGYGSAMLALRHRDRFCAAVSHSGALYFAHAERPMGPGYPGELMAALPAEEYDVFRLAEAAGGGDDTPALRLDCGLDDVLLASNRAFHAHLDKLGIAHEYAEHAGGHNWQYWRDHFGETLDFVLRHVHTP